jgi:hypothetical protein
MAYVSFLGNDPEFTLNWLHVRRNSNHIGLQQMFDVQYLLMIISLKCDTGAQSL